jgi:hypothetical protein
MWGFVPLRDCLTCRSLEKKLRHIPRQVPGFGADRCPLDLRVTKREAKGAAPSEQPLFRIIDLYWIIGGRD